SLDSTVIGQVSASDPEAQTVSYSIAYGDNDPLDGLFEINAEGKISLTAVGVKAFTNDYELTSNTHNITVVATDPAGNSSQIAVTLNEININERPLAENFSVDIADQDIVPIVFDTTGSDDHISDVDDDMLGNQVMVMLTSLPDAGTLLYTEGGVTREITESDLYDSQSGYLGTEFDPNFISYVPGSKNLFTFGDSDHSNMEDGQWGDPNEDNTVRTYTLDNDNVITLWITDQNGKPATFHLYKNENANDGYGLADNDGNGINGNGGQSDNGHETFHIDLAQNPLDVVYFGIDGVGGAQNGNSDNSIMVTYHLYDGNSETVNYEKPDGDVGNQQLSYEFSYSSPDNPIIGIEMTGDGGSWVLSYFSGAEALPDETSFTYVAIDSGVPVDENNTQTKLISDEATVTLDTSDAPSYNVFSAENGDSLNGQLGNDVLIGDEQANIFTWLDSTLDSGRDVIVDFELGNDKVDLLDILSDSPSTQEFNALIDSISVSVSGDNVELEVPINQDDSQTIVFENGASLFDSYIDSGAITQQNDLLNALLKDPSS
ncbi:Peptidase M10 serralysin C terminal, partial [Vibrio xiamenensis]